MPLPHQGDSNRYSRKRIDHDHIGDDGTSWPSKQGVYTCFAPNKPPPEVLKSQRLPLIWPCRHPCKSSDLHNTIEEERQQTKKEQQGIGKGVECQLKGCAPSAVDLTLAFGTQVISVLRTMPLDEKPGRHLIVPDDYIIRNRVEMLMSTGFCQFSVI